MRKINNYFVVPLISAFLYLSAEDASAQAMVSKGRAVVLKWFGGIEVVSEHNTQVETASKRFNFTVFFQLPDEAPGIRNNAYRLPLFWISSQGIFIGEGTVTPTGKVIARFHIDPSER